MKVYALTGLSFLLTSLVVGNAYYQKKQFYPTVVYLTKSNPCLAVLALQSLIVVLITGKLMCKIFFGQLRPAEIEHLIEKSWYAITETCLAFTVFREDFSASFVAMFTILLYLKCFHWLAEDRVDYMERSPALGCAFHFRITVLLSLLVAADAYFVQHAYLSTVAKGATAQVVFGFEYAILIVAVFMTFCKYTLHAVDMQNETPWESKAVMLLYLELVTSCAKLLLYSVFVLIMVRVHTFPLFAVRPLYLTLRAFKKAASDVVLSRRAIRNMNTLYPDATAEELRAGDVCIICREEMAAGCKKLPCGHVFHASCLRSWFQRQQTCPTCRLEVLRARPTAAAAQPAAAPPARAAAQAAAAQPPAAGVAAPMNAAAAAALAQWQAMFAVVPPLRWPPAPGFVPGVAAPQAGAQHQQQRDGAAGASASAAASGQQQQPAAATAGTTAAAASAASGIAPTGAEQPAFVWPAMQPLPFTIPLGMFPPLPPTMPSLTSLRGLSSDELRLLEGSERAQLEARVRWLRDIQTLLDAAVEQMAQYVAVTSSLRAQPAMPHPGAAAASTPAPDAAAGSGGGPAEQRQVGSGSDAAVPAPAAGGPATPVVRAAAGTAPQSSASAAEDGSPRGDLGAAAADTAEEPMPHWADPREEEYKDETQEVRRRRLQRLERDAAAPTP